MPTPSVQRAFPGFGELRSLSRRSVSPTYRVAVSNRVNRQGYGRLWSSLGAAVIGTAVLAACRWTGGSSGGDAAGSASADATTPAPAVTGAAQVITDLAYADTSPAQRLDLSLPVRTGTAVPLVVVIHGGAFQSGDKRDEPDIVAAANAAGFATASINYRLSGEAPWPAGAQDAKAAVRWLRAAAGQYGLDPDRFAAWGTSAGGTLASLLGTTGAVKSELDDPGLGFADRSSAVQAVVTWYGPSDFRTMDAQALDPGGCRGVPQAHDVADSPESRWLGAPVQESLAAAAASPITYHAPGTTPPPFYIAHGAVDCLVPHGQSLQLADALRAVGGQVSLHIVAKAEHADPKIPRTQTAASIAFLTKVFAAQP
jgi:acetyl esterase/lipase